MKQLLGIDTVITIDADNDGDIDGWHPYNDFNYWTGNPSYWEGKNLISSEPTFPTESPVGDIFISGYEQFDENCLFEFNFWNIDNKSIVDTSGNGNKGILIGDYGVKKEDLGTPATRDSYIKIPKTGTKNGAF